MGALAIRLRAYPCIAQASVAADQIGGPFGGVSGPAGPGLCGYLDADSGRYPSAHSERRRGKEGVRGAGSCPAPPRALAAATDRVSGCCALRRTDGSGRPARPGIRPPHCRKARRLSAANVRVVLRGAVAKLIPFLYPVALRPVVGGDRGVVTHAVGNAVEPALVVVRGRRLRRQG